MVSPAIIPYRPLMSGSSQVEEFKKAVRQYHSMPLLAAGVFVLLVLSSIWIGTSVWAAIAVAVIPTGLVLLFWIRAGRHLDSVGCPNCGEDLSSKMRWSYPPARCPRCSTELR
jgi:hypothetical protein